MKELESAGWTVDSAETQSGEHIIELAKQAAAEKNPRLKARIRYSSTEGSLTVDDIVKNTNSTLAEYHVYLCGPLPMIQAFEKKFIECGMPKDNIHYEEFNFR